MEGINFDEAIKIHEPSIEEQERVLGLSKREQLIEKCKRMNNNLTPIFESKLYHCDKCNDSGTYYQLDKHQFTLQTGEIYESEDITAHICECMKVRESMQILKDSGLTQIMKEHTFETYRTDEEWQKEVKNKAQDFVSNGIGTFYIGGQSGSGKRKFAVVY